MATLPCAFEMRKGVRTMSMPIILPSETKLYPFSYGSEKGLAHHYENGAHVEIATNKHVYLWPKAGDSLCWIYSSLDDYHESQEMPNWVLCVNRKTFQTVSDVRRCYAPPNFDHKIPSAVSCKEGRTSYTFKSEDLNDTPTYVQISNKGKVFVWENGYDAPCKVYPSRADFNSSRETPMFVGVIDRDSLQYNQFHYVFRSRTEYSTQSSLSVESLDRTNILTYTGGFNSYHQPHGKGSCTFLHKDVLSCSWKNGAIDADEDCIFIWVCDNTTEQTFRGKLETLVKIEPRVKHDILHAIFSCMMFSNMQIVNQDQEGLIETKHDLEGDLEKANAVLLERTRLVESMQPRWDEAVQAMLSAHQNVMMISEQLEWIKTR